MKINRFTDYGLRLLIYLMQPHDTIVTIAQAAAVLHISEHHLVKVAHFMAKQEWIISIRGKGGGIRVAPGSLTLPLGHLLQTLENDEKLVNCHEPPCVLRQGCGLRTILNEALAQFYHYLNRYQLQDMAQPMVVNQLMDELAVVQLQ